MADADRVIAAHEKWRTQDTLSLVSGLTYATTEIFVHVVPGASIAVYYNGQRLRRGVSDDFIVAESGGVGTGFDRVILSFAMKAGDTLCADYFVP